MANKVLVHSIQIHPTELQQPAPPKRGLSSFGSSLPIFEVGIEQPRDLFRVLPSTQGCLPLDCPKFDISACQSGPAWDLAEVIFRPRSAVLCLLGGLGNA
jgi:hypothetical protein